MSLVLNDGWYGYNSNTTYPFDMTATVLSDTGEILPNDIFTDAVFNIPSDTYAAVYLSALSMSKNYLSLVITGETVSGSVDLFEFEREFVEAGTAYRLTPLLENTSGYLVFGEAVSNYSTSNTYSTSIQTKFAPKCVKEIFSDTAIPYIGKEGVNTRLTGDIAVTGSPEVETGVVTVFPPDTPVIPDYQSLSGNDVGYIALSRQITAAGTVPQVFYANGVNIVAESRNIPGYQPIQFFGSVIPNCGGEITVRFDSQFSIAGVKGNTGYTGVIVGSNYSMTDVCGTSRGLPDPDGTLPKDKSKPEPDCEVVIDEVLNPVEVPDDWPVIQTTDYLVLPGPWNNPGAWQVMSGNWTFSSTYIDIRGTQALAGINYGIAGYLGSKGTGTTTRARIKFFNEDRYGKYNAIVAAGIRPLDAGLSNSVAYGCALNWHGFGVKDNVVKLMKYHRGFWEPLAEDLLAEGFDIDNEYTVELILGGTSDSLTLTGNIYRGPTDIIGTLNLSGIKNYGIGTGNAGLLTYSSALRLYSFQ